MNNRIFTNTVSRKHYRRFCRTKSMA